MSGENRAAQSYLRREFGGKVHQPDDRFAQGGERTTRDNGRSSGLTEGGGVGEVGVYFASKDETIKDKGNRKKV